MDADLDTLATGLYVTSDDFLADNPQYRPWRPRVGLAPRLTDAELVTLVVLQALLGFTSEARFLRYANTHLRGLFPYLPTQSGYNKRIRAAIGTLRAVIAHLVAPTSSVSDDVWVVDSTPIECGRSRETAKRSDLAGWAEYGYCASHSRFFWGLRLHLVCTLSGLPVAFALAGAKADEREVLLGMLDADPNLVAAHPNQKLMADKNYYKRHRDGKRHWEFRYTPTRAERLRAGQTAAVDPDSFTITVYDGQGGETPVTVSVAVLPQLAITESSLLLGASTNPSSVAV